VRSFLGLSGAWCVGQLSSELREIIHQHPRDLAGEESASESESEEEIDNIAVLDDMDESARNRQNNDISFSDDLSEKSNA
jgi:hypothetical protein